jgi:hypothetical protein
VGRIGNVPEELERASIKSDTLHAIGRR